MTPARRLPAREPTRRELRLFRRQLRPPSARRLRRLRKGMRRPCRCTCPWVVHQHLRQGTDCGRCGRAACPAFRRPRRRLPSVFGLIVFTRC